MTDVNMNHHLLSSALMPVWFTQIVNIIKILIYFWGLVKKYS